MDKSIVAAIKSPGPSSISAVFVFDPGLKEPKTHHDIIDGNLSRVLSQRGRACKFFSHKTFNVAQAEFQTYPAFRLSPYADIPALDERRFARQWRTYADDIAAIVREHGHPDHLLIHTATPAFIQGLAVAMHLRALQCSSLRLQLMFHPLSFLAEGEAPPTTAYARYLLALRMLQTSAMAAGTVLQVSTSCEGFANIYSRMLRQEVAIHPYALQSSEISESRQPMPLDCPGSRKVLLFSGNVKLDKGIGWIAEALPHLLQVSSDVEFYIQLSDARFGDSRLEAAIAQLRTIAAANPRLKLIEGYISATEWNTTLASMDALLIPYAPRAYRHKTSGILFEYLKLARPDTRIIITDDTWLAEEATHWRLPVASVDFANTAQLGEILASLDDYPALGNLRTAFPEFWGRYFGRGNDAFLAGGL